MIESSVNHLLIAAPQNVALRLKDILASAQIAPSRICYCGEDALREARDEGTLLLTTWRLPDMTGAELARKMGETCEVLMIVPQDYSAEEAAAGNVMTLRNPISQDALIQSIRVLGHCRMRMDALRERVQSLARKLEERKLIEQAKGRLMDRLHISEAEAHHRMQKQSMDTGRRIIEVAQEILSGEENIAS